MTSRREIISEEFSAIQAGVQKDLDLFKSGRITEENYITRQARKIYRERREKERLSRQNEQLRQQADQADIDPLIPGIYDSRAFKKYVTRDLKTAARAKLPKPGCLILFDLDHFKEVNDTFGHPFGDKVLITAAEIMFGNLRDTDFRGRLGGDEFGIFAAATTLKGAILLALRILRQLPEYLGQKYPQEQYSSFPTVTASVGIAEATSKDTYETLRERADKELYEAKREGNKIKVDLTSYILPQAPNTI